MDFLEVSEMGRMHNIGKISKELDAYCPQDGIRQYKNGSGYLTTAVYMYVQD
jgi:hypothetical protein